MYGAQEVGLMATARTGAERYLRDRKADPEYERAYNAARQRIDQIDRTIRALVQRPRG